ncbi:hypothetical protein PFISCL1PPCAC_12157, partial [Pristionchus fissidentatus]
RGCSTTRSSSRTWAAAAFRTTRRRMQTRPRDECRAFRRAIAATRAASCSSCPTYGRTTWDRRTRTVIVARSHARRPRLITTCISTC